MKMRGNTILITGGSSGIGLQMAKELIGLGNTVIITGRNKEKLDEVKLKFPQIHAFKSDVSCVDDILGLHAHISQNFPKLNWLINNAGIMKKLNLHQEISLMDLVEEIELNLVGSIQMIKQFLPNLKHKENAAIVNVSSGLAFVPLPISPVYSATKAGLHSFTQSLRVQLQNSNIKVFELAPPSTQTDLLNAFDQKDMKGVSIMDTEKMVHAALKGIENNKYEICPGQASQLRFMSRFAPAFILRQLSKPVTHMLSEEEHS